MFLKNNKGQGAIEYLLIIGGALLVGVIVLVLILSVSDSSRDNVEEANEAQQDFFDNAILQPIILDVDCNIDSNTVLTIRESPTKGVKGYKIIVNNNYQDGFVDSKTIVNNQIAFKSADIGITNDGNTYSVTLVAVKNDSYSYPVKPVPKCVAHD